MMALILSLALPQSTTMSNISNNNTVASSQQQRQGRIILLLDLDCFYAACERVRLGLPFETCSLALLQWNSVLAVTYPARRQYNIKRGDTWEQVHQKSNNHCLALHLPLLEINKTNNGTTGSGGVASSSLDDPDEESATIQSLYQKEYHLTPGGASTGFRTGTEQEALFTRGQGVSRTLSPCITKDFWCHSADASRKSRRRQVCARESFD
jgi:hypothetical protein